VCGLGVEEILALSRPKTNATLNVMPHANDDQISNKNNNKSK